MKSNMMRATLFIIAGFVSLGMLALPPITVESILPFTLICMMEDSCGGIITMPINIWFAIITIGLFVTALWYVMIQEKHELLEGNK